MNVGKLFDFGAFWSRFSGTKGEEEMTEIDELIVTAENEVGYLEKRSNNNLYSKTANAGVNHYTKYWAEISPEYQGLPWGACFVTWCFVKTFGENLARQLLRQYPYVHCNMLSGVFLLNIKPKRGDIVLFNQGGMFTHTGIVTGVVGGCFTTVEGSTNRGSMIVYDGSEVCRKGYYIDSLPGTRFCTPDYDLVWRGFMRG